MALCLISRENFENTIMPKEIPATPAVRILRENKADFTIERIYINAGERGLLAQILTKDLVRILKPIPVCVAV